MDILQRRFKKLNGKDKEPSNVVDLKANITKLEYLDSKNLHAEKLVDRLTVEVENFNSVDTSHLQDQIAQLQAQNHADQQTIAADQVQIAAHAAQITAKDVQIANLTADITAKDVQIVAHAAQITAKDVQIAQLNIDIAANQQTINQLTADIAAITAQINIGNPNNAMQLIQNQLTAENQKLTADKQQLETERQQLTAENQNCKTELVTLKAKHQQLTAENQNCKTELVTLTAENQQCQTELVKLKSEITKLRNQINGVGQPPNQQLIQLNEQNKKLTLELTKLKNQSKSQSSSSAQAQIQALTAEIDELQKKLNALPQGQPVAQVTPIAPPIAPGQPVAQGQPKGLLDQHKNLKSSTDRPLNQAVNQSPNTVLDEIKKGKPLRTQTEEEKKAYIAAKENRENRENDGSLSSIMKQAAAKLRVSVEDEHNDVSDSEWDGGGAEVLGGCMLMGLHRFLLIIIILILIFLIVLIFADVSKCLVK